MIQPIQHEMHPDADQLSAFAEGALPAHERDRTLAHLAICAACREVVNLSLPQLQDVPQAAPVPARRPWLSAWKLAWPVAVLAAAVVLGVHLHTKASQEEGVRVGTVVAPPPPATPVQTPVVADKPAAVATARSGRTQLRERRAEAATEQASDAMAEDAAKLPVEGREVAELLKVTPGAAMAHTATKKPQAPSTTVYGVKLGVAGMSGISGAASAPPMNMSAAAPMGTIVVNNAAAEPNAAGTPAAAHAAQPPVSAGNVTATVSVQAAAAPLELSASDTAGAIQPETVPTLPTPRPLPSGLAAISVASEKKQTVAIDLHNNVFVSKNGGKRWKPVSALWQGRAIKVEYAGSFVLTTDHDGLWISPDGRSWSRK